MAQPIKTTTTVSTTQTQAKVPVAKHPPAPVLFEKENLKWMLIGILVLAVGFFLMTGGKSDNPNTFDTDSVYSITRITIAPILIIAGFIIEIFAIMRRPKNTDA